MVEKQMKFMKLEIHVHPKKNWGYMFKKVHFSGGLLQLNLPRKKQKLLFFSGLRSLLQGFFMKVHLPNVAILFPYHLDIFTLFTFIWLILW